MNKRKEETKRRIKYDSNEYAVKLLFMDELSLGKHHRMYYSDANAVFKIILSGLFSNAI